MQIEYKILVRDGVSSKIGISAYREQLVESLDLTILETLENIDDVEVDADNIMVQLPTTLSKIQEIPCPNPNLADKCQLLTAKIILIGTEETWDQFERTLEVAIAIGRLRFNLYQVDSNSPVEILDSFWRPDSV